MFGDDQYENFKEDVVPPFAVLAYDGHEIEPWKNRTWNPWGEPNDARFSYSGHRAAGKYMASGLLEAGIDTAQSLERADHQPGTDQQDQRQRNLHSDQSAAGAVSFPARGCSG